MKKLLVLIAILAFCLIPGFVTKAEQSTVQAGDVYIDIDDSIEVTTSYNNIVSLNSANNNVATAVFDKTTKKLTIKGVSKGDTTITMRIGNSTDYTDYIYTVYVISEFGRPGSTYNRCTYDYNKLTINYDNTRLPEGCVPVFSLDGKNWSESNTIVRNQNDDGYVYKNYKVDGVLKGKTTKIIFNTKKSEKTTSINKEITIKKGETISIKKDLSLDLYLIKYSFGPGWTIEKDEYVSFDKNAYTIKGLKTGKYNYLYIDMLNKKTDFATDGSYIYYINCYFYKITVTNEDGSLYDNNSANDNTNPYYGGTRNSESVGDDGLPGYEYEWVQNDKGWRCIKACGIIMNYLNSGWECIDNIWYYFDSNAYMASDEYRDGCWLNADGSWNSAYSNGAWKSNSTGWWYEDVGWYPTSQWMKIDGYWYYFKADGYMASNEYIDGYWLGADGAWR